MKCNLSDVRTEGDKKQKNHLRSLGYSENVIIALFPCREEEKIFLDNGSNLIEGFEIALRERK